MSAFALVLLLSGLPWAKSWGGNLEALRHLASAAGRRQDWTTGRSSEIARRLALNVPATADEHAAHHQNGGIAAISQDYSAIDRLLPTVQQLQLPPPVLIAPPSRDNPDWTARSDTQNRPQRVDLVLDDASGAVLSRRDFAQRPLMDRIIGVGIAAHEGQLFGWINQLISVLLLTQN